MAANLGSTDFSVSGCSCFFFGKIMERFQIPTANEFIQVGQVGTALKITEKKQTHGIHWKNHPKLPSGPIGASSGCK